MVASKVGLQYQKSDAFNDDGEVTWSKYVCGFPEPRIYGEKYKEWRNAMKCKMEQDRISGWKGSTVPQWAVIQAYALATLPNTLQSGRHSGRQIQPGANVLQNALIFC